ncbi:NAD(P)H-dependent oxidoreductase [Paenibacillus donghaensis]|uniref:NAD(P)H-dependent oxidoreductase n=1 Tax=Paenibacillus TaxID=44249 RepID=UPI001883260B|nr:NAD(P)H-dependent oxidoreductase [Paenibacillus donghaensis]MBE9913913.1 NAD(P)H-dependent oxidoreductase [Paenibacillus donghaensis]
MKHLIVYAHPRTNSFNHVILDTAVNTLKKNGHDVVVRDLYELGFQPVLTAADIASMRKGVIPEDIKNEQLYITEADVIIFISPIWWTGLPAILKGYVDRVFAKGFAYASGEEGIVKLLKGKKGLIINTHGAPKEVYNQIGMTDGLKITSDTGIFDFTGIEAIDHLLFGSVPDVDDAARNQMLQTVEQTIQTHFA